MTKILSRNNTGNGETDYQTYNIQSERCLCQSDKMSVSEYTIQTTQNPKVQHYDSIKRQSVQFQLQFCNLRLAT